MVVRHTAPPNAGTWRNTTAATTAGPVTNQAHQFSTYGGGKSVTYSTTKAPSAAPMVNTYSAANSASPDKKHSPVLAPRMPAASMSMSTMSGGGSPSTGSTASPGKRYFPNAGSNSAASTAKQAPISVPVTLVSNNTISISSSNPLRAKASVDPAAVAMPSACTVFNHQTASSLISTSVPSDDLSESTPPRPLRSPRQPWALERTLRLCSKGNPVEDQLLQRAVVLDHNAVSSVGTAVEMLNRGAIRCLEDFCIAFSAQNQAYFLLYRAGRKEVALARLGVTHEDGQQVAQAPASPRLRQHPSASASTSAAAPVLSSPPVASSTPSKPAAGVEVQQQPSSPSRTSLRSATQASSASSRPPLEGISTEPVRSVSKAAVAALAPSTPISRSPSKPVVGAAMAATTPTTPAAKLVETPSQIAVRQSTKQPAAAAIEESPPQSECVEEVEVGGRQFQLLKVIGRGAFGVVWQAREITPEGLGESNIAMKAVVAKTSKAFAAAAFEAELLRLLTARLPPTAWDKAPRYVTHSCSRSPATSSGDRGGSVRCAMSYLKGAALDQWLYGISDEEHKRVDAKMLVEGRLPGGRQRSFRLQKACDFTKNLVLQLVQVFSVLQSIAFHRDVSSHNVLADVDDNDVCNASVSLIDFGLAVRSGSWHREWCTSNLAGDPRYWAPPAWMGFAFGFRYLETHPNRGFQRQYLQRIDHFSLGILGLEVMFALWNWEDPDEESVPGMIEAKEAWTVYWHAVVRLFQMFHRQGAQEVRTYIARSQEDGVARVAEHLRHLRQALRTAASDPANSKRAAMLTVLADLVDERGTLSWDAMPAALEASSASVPMAKGVVAASGSNHVSASSSSSRPQASTVSTSASRPAASILDDRALAAALDTARAAVVAGATPQHAGEVRRYEALPTGGYGVSKSSALTALTRPASYVAAPLPKPTQMPYTAPVYVGLSKDAQRGIQEAKSLLSSWSALPVGGGPSLQAAGCSYEAPGTAVYLPKPHSYVPPAVMISRSNSYVPPPQQSASYVPLPVAAAQPPQPVAAFYQSANRNGSWVPSPMAASGVHMQGFGSLGGFPQVISHTPNSTTFFGMQKKNVLI